MHPKVFEVLGDRPQAQALMQQTLDAIRSEGMKVDRPTFHAPPVFLETADKTFAIVPYTVKMEAGDERAEAVTYQIGVLEKGTSTWKYVDVARGNPEQLRRLFPEFPADYTFPVANSKSSSKHF